MAKTIAQLFERVRDKLDDKVTPYLWSNLELIDYYNESHNDFAEKALLLFDDNSTFLNFNILAVDLSNFYSLDERIIQVENVYLKTLKKNLTKITFEELPSYGADWRTQTGEPIHYCVDAETGKILIFPKTLTTDIVHLSVYRLPLYEAVLTSAGTPPSSGVAPVVYQPEINSKYHLYLVDGMLAQAYDKQDAETYDPGKSKYHRTLFESYVEKAKQAQIRLKKRDETCGPHSGTI